MPSILHLQTLLVVLNDFCLSSWNDWFWNVETIFTILITNVYEPPVNESSYKIVWKHLPQMLLLQKKIGHFGLYKLNSLCWLDSMKYTTYERSQSKKKIKNNYFFRAIIEKLICWVEATNELNIDLQLQKHAFHSIIFSTPYNDYVFHL